MISPFATGMYFKPVMSAKYCVELGPVTILNTYLEIKQKLINIIVWIYITWSGRVLLCSVFLLLFHLTRHSLAYNSQVQRFLHVKCCCTNWAKFVGIGCVTAGKTLQFADFWLWPFGNLEGTFSNVAKLSIALESQQKSLSLFSSLCPKWAKFTPGYVTDVLWFDDVDTLATWSIKMINFHLWSGSTAIQMVTTVEPTCATTYRQSPVKVQSKP